MKVSIKKDECIGCGACVGTCSDVFEFDDEGKASVVAAGDVNGNADAVQEAADSCPVQAIVVE